MSNEPRSNVNIQVPTEFSVVDGTPPLPTTGKAGVSKYSALMETAKKLKPNQQIPVDVGGESAELQKAFVRNLRVAIKRFAPGVGLKVTALGTRQVSIYREAASA